MSAHDIDCIELVELVTDFLEDALDGRSRARVEAHLAACPGCAAYVEQMRTTIALTGRVTPDDLSPDARTALLDAFRGWRDARPAGAR